MNNLYDGAGCQWWSHVGALGATTTYPSGGQGASAAEAAYASSSLHGAKVVVIYKIIVTAGAAGTVAIGVESGGTIAALTGLDAFDTSVTGTEYDFPGGLRVEHGTNANVGVTTDASATVTVFYRKIA